MKKYRNEWKYICNSRELTFLQNKLKGVLDKDAHSNKDGIYVVHNLYFDDYYDTCAKMTEAGDAIRYKWRIRYYGNDTKNIKLELKEKLYGRCHKETCKLTYKEYKKIINNNVSDIIWETDKELLKRFCVDIMNRYFRPKVIIEYERVAYVDTFMNIRVTFDKNISSSYEVDKFITNDYVKFPMQDKDTHIVEVKFDDILPGYIKEMVNTECKMQIAFSKYYNGRRMLEVIK